MSGHGCIICRLLIWLFFFYLRMLSLEIEKKKIWTASETVTRPIGVFQSPRDGHPDVSEYESPKNICLNTVLGRTVDNRDRVHSPTCLLTRREVRYPHTPRDTPVVGSRYPTTGSNIGIILTNPNQSQEESTGSNIGIILTNPNQSQEESSLLDSPAGLDITSLGSWSMKQVPLLTIVITKSSGQVPSCRILQENRNEYGWVHLHQYRVDDCRWNLVQEDPDDPRTDHPNKSSNCLCDSLVTVSRI